MANQDGVPTGHVSILQPGRNCWRVEAARRASFRIDGDANFSAFRAAATRVALHHDSGMGFDSGPERCSSESFQMDCRSDRKVLRELLHRKNLQPLADIFYWGMFQQRQGKLVVAR